VEFALELILLSRVPGVGPGRVRSLVTVLGSPAAVRRAGPGSLASVPGIGSRLASVISGFYRSPALRVEEERARAVLGRLEDIGAAVIHLWDPAYPELLARTYDPPVLLFTRGEIHPADHAAIAVVGTRKPSPYGLEVAGYFGRELSSAGLTVVSGLARGIDTGVHLAAMEAGGRSLAVIGTGLDRCYPPENGALASRVASAGAVISEFEPGTEPEAGNFPRRNRVISGLSLGTLVVESDSNGGAMITASCALDQNREVFAVPGRIGSRVSRGCHALIRDGRAKLVEHVDDVLAEIRAHLPPGTGSPGAAPSARPALTRRENRVYACVGAEPLHADALTASTGLPAGQLIADLLALEMKGLVRQLPGKFFIRTL